MRRWILMLLLGLFLLHGLGVVAAACPTCKDGISQQGDAAGIVRGYFLSIIFMMSMPFLIFGSLASYFYYEVRKARRLTSSAPHSSPAVWHQASGSTN